MSPLTNRDEVPTDFGVDLLGFYPPTLGDFPGSEYVDFPGSEYVDFQFRPTTDTRSPREDPRGVPQRNTPRERHAQRETHPERHTCSNVQEFGTASSTVGRLVHNRFLPRSNLDIIKVLDVILQCTVVKTVWDNRPRQ